MRYWFLFFFVFPLSVGAADSASPKDMTEAFFSSIKKGDISGAYDRLFIGSSIPQNKPQAVTLLKQQTSGGLPFYGKIVSYEVLKDEKYGKSIERFVYVLKSEKAPTIWEFYFYKPKDLWFLAYVVFNDQFSLLR